MAKKKPQAKWYVAHTYSGYENKVKADIEKTIENRNLKNQIMEVAVPIQSTIEYKNGEKRNVEKKIFPGYVLVRMVLNDDTWYAVRNTHGVTGFVGPGSRPVPLSDDELSLLADRKQELYMDFEVGDSVGVVEGVWKDTVGVIRSINESKRLVTINVELFGRETPVEISFDEVKKV